MSRIVLSTSSSCIDLLNIEHSIRTIPLHIQINGVDFLDGQNINLPRLAALMDVSDTSVASTSPPSEDEVKTLCLELYETGVRDIFICSLSSKFSDSFAIFQRVKQALSDKLNIYVYDTKTLNIAEGAMAYEADVMLKEGKSFSEIAQRLDKIQQNGEFIFTLYNLDYIIRNKKLSAPAGFFANLFDIKPILEINKAGVIATKEKIRKIDRALSYLGESMYQLKANQPLSQPPFIYIASIADQADVDYFVEILANKYGLVDLPVIPVSSISMANHGPRGVGIGAFTGELPRIVNAFR